MRTAIKLTAVFVDKYRYYQRQTNVSNIYL